MIADQIDVLGEHGSFVTLIVLGKSFEGGITSTNSYVEFQHTEDVTQGDYSNSGNVEDITIWEYL